VASVEGGRKCMCICPSCRTPLIARKGNVKEWHFAHHSRNVKTKTKEKCEYSFSVSIRLMIRQLAQEGLKLRTPGLVDSLLSQSDVSFEYKEIEFVVAKESLIDFEWIAVGTVFTGVEVDILGLVNRIPLAIYITYPGREVPAELATPETEYAAVLEIDLRGLEYLFSREVKGRHMQLLRNYLESSLDGKSWFYHPRANIAREKAQAKMEEWLSQREPKPENKEYQGYDNNTYSDIKHRNNDYKETKIDPFSVPKNEAKDFKCLVCDFRWRGTSRHCTKCDTHLYTTEACN
jgi:hypothetical protein